MFKLKPEQLTKILNYLATRPWREVNDLIQELANLEKEKANEEKKE